MQLEVSPPYPSAISLSSVECAPTLEGLAPKSDNEVMCWLEIKQNLGRAGLEAQGRAGLRRRPCEARKFRVFETQITQICLPFEGTHVGPVFVWPMAVSCVQTRRKRMLNKGIMKTPAK